MTTERQIKFAEEMKKETVGFLDAQLYNLKQVLNIYENSPSKMKETISINADFLIYISNLYSQLGEIIMSVERFRKSQTNQDSKKADEEKKPKKVEKKI